MLVDNELSVYFRQDKTECNLFGTKHKLNKVGKLNITHKGIDIKQHSAVAYLGCILDDTMSAESMAFKTLKENQFKT